MNMPRRIFNRYLVTGLAGGACIGFVAGRYSVQVEPEVAGPVTAVEALRAVARTSEGVHLIGQSIDGLQQLSLAGTERLLLERLELTGSQELRPEEFAAALDALIRSEYARGELAPAGEYLLSRSEQLFVAYAVVSQGLHEVAYTPPQPEVKDGVIAEGAKFGPNFTVVGRIFNEQPDGHGGLWVLAENTPPGTVITINGQEIKTTRKQTSMTGAVYDEQLQELISEPAKHEVALFVPETGIRQVMGQLEVRPRPPAATLEDGSPSTVYCEITQWRASSGADEDRIHIDTLCGPRSSAIYVGDTALSTKVLLTGIEGRFSRAMFAPGEYPVRLVDTLSGEAVAIGTLTVD